MSLRRQLTPKAATAFLQYASSPAGRGVERLEWDWSRGAVLLWAGESGVRVAGCGVEDMGAKTPGWRSGSSPEAARRCASSRRALRATAVPVRLNVDGDGVFLVESTLEFVADGAENAGHRGALTLAPASVQLGASVGIFIMEPVSVQVITLLIASYGAVVATFNLIQTVMRERRGINIYHAIQYLSFDEEHYNPFLVITLVNRGYRPAVVLLPVLLLNGKDELELFLSDDAKEFPKTLEDGEIAQLRVSGKYLTAVIKDEEYTGSVKAQIICFDSTGRRYSSKEWTLEA
jgi:hypothetical protein